MICQKKKKNLSRYSTYIESSQAHVEMSKTLEQLCGESRVKIVRLFLCTKMKTEKQSSESEEAGLSIIAPFPVIELTECGQNETTKVLHMENKNSELELDLEIVFGASTGEDAQMDDTLPWEDLHLQTLEESHLAPETITIISRSSSQAPSVIDINSEKR